MKELPIVPHLDTICQTLLDSPTRFLVLTAETAAGKSTMLLIALLSRFTGKIVMLEPRRIATVAIADRISRLLGEKTGETAGYSLHLDSRISARTRIEVITEAILTRRIQADPSLAGISVVILDEFHERSVHADLCLALLREIVSLRDDLYVVVMSATIETSHLSSYLGAPVLNIPGRLWPIEIMYDGDPGTDRYPSLETKVANAVKKNLDSSPGNLLVFLPGIGEIRRVGELLSSIKAEVLPLHSSVPFPEQKKILEAPDETEKNGRKRVILSSSIAETSITVPGVSTVIDCGFSRIGCYDIPTGMYRLVTQIESEFSASQRAGRSGRNGKGRCIRLWPEYEKRLSEIAPEIQRTDCMSLVLECALWGITEPLSLDWLDPPNGGAWSRAQNLLKQMEALDGEGKITGHGRNMSTLGVHPRIAAVALCGSVALAVKYSNYSENPREIERFRADLQKRVDSCRKKNSFPAADRVNSESTISLLSGFPDRIGRHTGEGIYQFPSGRLASLKKATRESFACFPRWIIAVEADSGEREGRIHTFEELNEKDAEIWLLSRSEPIVEVIFAEGNDIAKGIKKTAYRKYGKLILSEQRLETSDEDFAPALCAYVREKGLAALPWSPASEAFVMRARFWYCHQNTGSRDNPADENNLTANLEKWLAPFVPAKRSLTEASLLDALRAHFDAIRIDREVPEKIVLPSLMSRTLKYEILVPGEGPVPVLETKIQDLFGCKTTPSVMKVPVLLRLLSPSRRPLQVTYDLAGFWKNTWPDVIKEMKGRYPKHKWPANPHML